MVMHSMDCDLGIVGQRHLQLLLAAESCSSIDGPQAFESAWRAGTGATLAAQATGCQRGSRSQSATRRRELGSGRPEHGCLRAASGCPQPILPPFRELEHTLFFRRGFRIGFTRRCMYDCAAGRTFSGEMAGFWEG